MGGALPRSVRVDQDKNTRNTRKSRVEQYAPDGVGDGFARSQAEFESLVATLTGPEMVGLTHADLEDHLQVRGRDLLRCLLQDHLSLRAVRERRVDRVVGADGVARGAV